MFCGKIGLLCSRSQSQRRFKMLVNVWLDDIFWTAEHFVTRLYMMMQQHEPKCHEENFCFFGVLSSRSRSQQGLIWLKYDYYIFWIVNSSKTKLGLMIHHCTPECLTKKKMDYFIQGQVYSEESKCPDDIFQTAKHLWPNLALLCIIMNRSVRQKDWFAISKVKVTAKVHIIKIWQFNTSSELLILWYQTWFNSTLS